jgi:Flp pilus assembly pilin Flp
MGGVRVAWFADDKRTPRERRTGQLKGGNTMVGARLHGLRDQAGQTMAEYAVNLTIITVAIVVAISLLSAAISAQLTTVVGIL